MQSLTLIDYTRFPMAGGSIPSVGTIGLRTNRFLAQPVCLWIWERLFGRIWPGMDW